MKIGLAGEQPRPAVSKGTSVGSLHALFADDARALLLTELFGTPYSETILGALEHGLIGGNEEYRAFEELTDGELTGVALFGFIAGTVGTTRLLFVAAGSRALIDAVLAQATSNGGLLIAELPDDRPFDRMRKLLVECGFHEESRIPDLYRDGVALTFLRA